MLGEMMNTTVQPTLVDMEIEALLRTGLYQSRDEIISEAMRNLLLNNKALRLELAIELFKTDEVSLGRAAEIAGTDRWDFQDILHQRHIPIIIEAESAEAMDRDIEKFFGSGKMIIADTSILSTFARIQRLDLLFAVVETTVIHLPPAVQNEITFGLQKGLHFLQPIIDALTAKTQFHSIELTAEEKRLMLSFPKALNAGEKEGIAICLARTDNKFITNDKRAHNFCLANNILSLDLKRILRRLWKNGYCSKPEIRKLMEDIESSEPGMVIKGKYEILK